MTSHMTPNTYMYTMNYAFLVSTVHDQRALHYACVHIPVVAILKVHLLHCDSVRITMLGQQSSIQSSITNIIMYMYVSTCKSIIIQVHRVKMFQDRYESRTKFPNVFRVTKLVSYFLYIIHVYSCIYYSVSEKEGFGVNRWVYDGNGTR